jgi:hypothetical protein
MTLDLEANEVEVKVLASLGLVTWSTAHSRRVDWLADRTVGTAVPTDP